MSVIVEKDQDGYFVFCPELQGCYTQGDTYEEAMENIKDAIRLHIEDRLESGEDIPWVCKRATVPYPQSRYRKYKDRKI